MKLKEPSLFSKLAIALLLLTVAYSVAMWFTIHYLIGGK